MFLFFLIKLLKNKNKSRHKLTEHRLILNNSSTSAVSGTCSVNLTQSERNPPKDKVTPQSPQSSCCWFTADWRRHLWEYPAFIGWDKTWSLRLQQRTSLWDGSEILLPQCAELWKIKPMWTYSSPNVMWSVYELILTFWALSPLTELSCLRRRSFWFWISMKHFEVAFCIVSLKSEIVFLHKQ